MQTASSTPPTGVMLDAQLAVGTATGIGVYIRGLLDAFALSRVAIRPLQARWLDPWRFDRRVLWDQIGLPLAARGATLLHCPAGTMPLAHRGPIVVTVHDTAWLRVQQHARPYARSYFGRFMIEQYKRAERIIVVSEFARRELLELASIEAERITVVHNGVDAAYRSIVHAPGSTHPRLLAIGTIEPRKNLAVLIEALALMRNRSARLIVPGPATPYQTTCRARAHELAVADRIDFLGYISQAALLEEYARASVALVPSLYEGFGYAAAQALVAGVPCVVSTSASLPEIVDTAAPCVAADDPLAWAAKCDAILENIVSARLVAEQYRARAAVRFDWATAAGRTRAVYEAALAQKAFIEYQ